MPAPASTHWLPSATICSTVWAGSFHRRGVMAASMTTGRELTMGAPGRAGRMDHRRSAAEAGLVALPVLVARGGGSVNFWVEGAQGAHGCFRFGATGEGIEPEKAAGVLPGDLVDHLV